MKRRDPIIWLPVKGLVLAAAAVAGVGVLAMTLIICADIIMRLAGCSRAGAYDLVRLAGGVTLAAALPLTTALKGHVAIEYFFNKLRRRGRLVVDIMMRLLQIVIFVVAAHASLQYGQRLRSSGEVTPTLQLPTFWLAWVVAGCCALTALVTLYQLLHPRRKMLRVE